MHGNAALGRIGRIWRNDLTPPTRGYPATRTPRHPEGTPGTRHHNGAGALWAPGVRSILLIPWGGAGTLTESGSARRVLFISLLLTRDEEVGVEMAFFVENLWVMCITWLFQAKIRALALVFYPHGVRI